MLGRQFFLLLDRTSAIALRVLFHGLGCLKVLRVRLIESKLRLRRLHIVKETRMRQTPDFSIRSRNQTD